MSDLSKSSELIDAMKLHYLFYFFEFDEPFFEDSLDDEEEITLEFQYLYEAVLLGHSLSFGGVNNIVGLRNYFSIFLAKPALYNFLFRVLCRGYGGFDSFLVFRGYEFAIADIFAHLHVQESICISMNKIFDIR